MSVLFEEIPLGASQRFKMGQATLNLPSSLNSLTLEMIQKLQEQFLKWSENPQIAFIFLQGTGEKAFCAGGDIRRLYDAITTQNYLGAEEFFHHEYRLDYWIHTAPKPVIVWGHGIVMGGGLGLMAGAALRVVTENSKIAMPEISIGLYPEVGATYFLSRMPEKMGLFSALSAIRLNAQDAQDLKLADFTIAQTEKENFLSKIKSIEATGASNENLIKIQKVAEDFQRISKNKIPAGEILKRKALIQEAMAGKDILEVSKFFEKISQVDSWIENAYKTFCKGSPTSAAVIFEQLKSAPKLSLKEAFQKEYEMSSQFARHHDLREGIRALIIDKDNKPLWEPSRISEVPSSLIQEHFQSPWKERKVLL